MPGNPDGPTFEITLKLTHHDEHRTQTICCHEILADFEAPGVGEQIGEIVAQALTKLFSVPCRYDVTNLRACVDHISSDIDETHRELFDQFPEQE